MVQDGFLFDPEKGQADQGIVPSNAARSVGSQGAGKAATASRKKLPATYSVTQLTRLIKITLAQHLPGRVLVAGEISNFKQHSSGHLYLTLKDAQAQLPAVMWKSAVARLKFKPADGQAVLATGHIDVYEPHGKYQFYLDKLEPAGQGALELALRQLAEKLRGEGLFDDAHKKQVPALPRTIAIVTSGTGAAIEDISKTLHRRFKIVRKLLYPVAVQGDAAAGEIAGAIGKLNQRSSEFDGIDVIILARGGGSLEDLWAFNEEVVARAVFASEIPIITGIGHEIDTSIADLVADCRAATPTAAAELAVPVLEDIRQNVLQCQQRLRHSLRNRCDIAAHALDGLASRSVFVRPRNMVQLPGHFIDEQFSVLHRCVIELLRQGAGRLEKDALVLRRIEPHAAMAKARGCLAERQQALGAALREYMQKQTHGLGSAEVRLKAASPVRRTRQEIALLSGTARRLAQGQEHLRRRQQEYLDGLGLRLASLNPRAVLHRGYSITRLKNAGEIVTADSPPAQGEIITTELSEQTTFESQVTKGPARPDTA